MIYLTLFLEFFKIGLFTIGGGYAMIPIVQDTVLEHGWMTSFEFLDLLGVCESTPGPIAVNMATYIGSTQAGILGGLIATIGVVLPSFLIMLLIASLLKKVNNNGYFQAFIKGVVPVVSGLIACCGLFLIANLIGFQNVSNIGFNLIPLLIFLAVSTIYCLVRYVFKKNFNTILFICVSAVVGLGMCLIFI